MDTPPAEAVHVAEAAGSVGEHAAASDGPPADAAAPTDADSATLEEDAAASAAAEAANSPAAVEARAEAERLQRELAAVRASLESVTAELNSDWKDVHHVARAVSAAKERAEEELSSMQRELADLRERSSQRDAQQVRQQGACVLYAVCVAAAPELTTAAAGSAGRGAARGQPDGGGGAGCGGGGGRSGGARPRRVPCREAKAARRSGVARQGVGWHDARRRVCRRSGQGARRARAHQGEPRQGACCNTRWRRCGAR